MIVIISIAIPGLLIVFILMVLFVLLVITAIASVEITMTSIYCHSENLETPISLNYGIYLQSY